MKPMRHRLPRLLAVLAGLATFVIPASAAERRGWVWVDSEITGEATDPAHGDWLEIDSFSATGQAPLPGSTVTLRRRIDKASPLLFKACSTGQVFPEIRLHLSQLEEGSSRLFWDLTLNNVRIISCRNSGPNGSNGSPLEEEVEFIHEGVRMTYYQLSDPAALPVTTILPYTGDADGDGMSDEFETQFALLLHSDDGARDADGDGLSNLEESRVGTDPTKGSSFFKATTAPGAPGSNELILTWNSVPGASYRVRFSPDLTQPFDVIATVTATGPSCSHPVIRGSALGFYRVEKVEP
jgi:type VI secretion system Hcp family effector